MGEEKKPCPKCGSNNVRSVNNKRPVATVVWCNDCGFSVCEYDEAEATEWWNSLSDIAKPLWSRRVKSERKNHSKNVL